MKQTALVTGAAKGIGLGITKKLCGAGRRVIMLGHSREVLEQASRLEEEGYEVYGLLCDITDGAAVKKMAEEIYSRWGSVQILVNNAGVAKLNRFEETDDEMLDLHINTNLKGTWRMIQSLIPHMKEQRYGRIVNLSSVTGLMVCDKGYTAYGMTKAGIVGLTKTIAVEYAEYGITCNAVCPGFVLTPNVERNATVTCPNDPGSVLSKMADRVPAGRLGTPEDIGALVTFLTSQEAGYITGTVNVIDGGSLLPETGVMGKAI